MYSVGWMCSSLGEDKFLIGVKRLDCELGCATSGEIIRTATQVAARGVQHIVLATTSVGFGFSIHPR